MAGKEKGKSAFDEVTDVDNAPDDDESNETTRSESDSKNTDQSDSGSTTKKESRDTQSDNPDQSKDTVSDVSNSEPATASTELDQHPLYLTDDAWGNYDDIRFEIEHVLRKEYGIKNATKRELDNAFFTAITDLVSAEQIAAEVVESRGFDADDIKPDAE